MWAADSFEANIVMKSLYPQAFESAIAIANRVKRGTLKASDVLSAQIERIQKHEHLPPQSDEVWHRHSYSCEI